MKVFDKTWKLAVAGALVGVLAALLAYFGNPANMAICIACFVRDTAGALKLHSAAPVQYFRPEIVGFAVGAFAISLVTNEYKATAGSSPMIRFVLGAIMVIGALVFLGCPLRMVLRMAAGDLNAYVALVGFAGGIATGSFFLKKGFSLGRAYETQKSSGYVLPVLLLALFIIGAVTGVYAASTEGPGSKHAPLFRSADRALPASLEYSGYVCRWICSRSGWRMPAASDHSGRAGLLGQCGNLSGNAVRGGTCTQF